MTRSTLKSLERKIAEGRGQGFGRDYKPWLLIHEVPSKGLANRILGWKTERIHHLMSLMERDYFFLLEWADEVLDIREQYPLLPIEETLMIADYLGVKHPTNPKTKERTIMTSDFLLTFKNSLGETLGARAVKPSEELNKKRTIEKLKIEEIYWMRRKIPWKIVTEKEISTIKARNILWLHPRHTSESLPVSEAMIPVIGNALAKKIIRNPLQALSIYTREVDTQLQIPKGSSLAVVRYLLASKQWYVDMSVRLNPDRPLSLINPPVTIKEVACNR